MNANRLRTRKRSFIVTVKYIGCYDNNVMFLPSLQIATKKKFVGHCWAKW